jgi:lactoylglutathione lyase
LRLPGEEGELQLMHVPGGGAFGVPERLMHLAYRVDDMGATLPLVLAAGATLEKGPYPIPSGSIVAFVRDPDGYDLELVEKRQP